MHDIKDLVRLFNDLFQVTENTILVPGGGEPLYQPASHTGNYHRVICRLDYYASALHEMAHWCIAGAGRRRQLDYGYWYQPDGRTAEQQNAFVRVEAKPQALEWIFSRACGFRFQVSLDNLNGEAIDSMPFKKAVVDEARILQQRGLKGRTAMLQQSMAAFYKQPVDVSHYQFTIEELV